jgi:hypothetical protein
MGTRHAGMLAFVICVGSMHLSTSLAQAPVAQHSILVCTGALARASNMVWYQQQVEFALDYVSNAQVANLKSNIAFLNAMLLVDANEAFLRGRESSPRPLGATDRSFAISELTISRNTGAFTMVLSSFHDIDRLDGNATWEGACNVQGAADKKF